MSQSKVVDKVVSSSTNASNREAAAASLANSPQSQKKVSFQSINLLSTRLTEAVCLKIVRAPKGKKNKNILLMPVPE